MNTELKQKLSFTISQFIAIDEREAHKAELKKWAYLLNELKGTTAHPFIWAKFKSL